MYYYVLLYIIFIVYFLIEYLRTVFTRELCFQRIICWNYVKYHFGILIYYTQTNVLLCHNSLKSFTLKHLKCSYMFRSLDHPQGAHLVPC